MTVLLAFAVAAFLEPEILVVDEVLAVGDAEFQKKAIGKMQDISKTQGRTVLFVSHNMAAVKSLCTRGIVLENGTLKFDGTVDAALDVYNEINKSEESIVVFDANTKRSGTKNLQFHSVEISNQHQKNTQEYAIGDDLNIKIKIKNNTNEKKSEIGIQIFTTDEMPVFHMMSRDSNFEIVHEKEEEEFVINVADIRLFPGIYYISLTSASSTGHQVYDSIDNVVTFEITDGGLYTTRSLPRVAGLFFLNPNWKKN